MIKKATYLFLFIIFVGYLYFVHNFSNSLQKSTQENSIQEFKKYQKVLDQSFASLIVSEFSKMEQELILVSELESVKDADIEKCNDSLFKVTSSTTTLLNNITRVGPDKVFICSANPKNTGVDGSQYAYINEIFEDPNHKIVLSTPFLTKTPKGVSTVIMAIHVPVYNSQGDFVGTLGGTFYLNDFVEKFTELNDLPKGSWPLIITIPDGVLLYHPNTDYLNKSIYSEDFSNLLNKNSDVKKVLDNAVYEDGIQLEYYTYAGSKNIGTTNHIEPLPGEKWSLVISSPIDVVYKDVNSTLQKQRLLYISLVSVVVFLSLVAFIILVRGNVILKRQVDSKTKDLKIQADKLEKSSVELRKFKEAADSAYDHIIITDPEGIILYANDAVEKITGYKKKEIIGKKAGSKDLWGGLMPKEFYKKMWKTIKIDKKSFVGQIENRRKNGQRYFALSTISPVLNSSDKVDFFVGIERDITKEKEVDTMKTDFISLVSHQLRTPLSAMKWFLEMLLDGDVGKLSKEQKEYIQNIDESNERMISLVNDLLNISRIESGRIKIDPEPTDLSKLVNSVIEEYTALCLKEGRRKLNIHLKVTGAIPVVSVDPKLIRNVFSNLIGNAYKYSKPNGKVTVELTVDKKFIVCSVEDSGIGIPEGQKNKIFDKFFRATNAQSVQSDGTGLGLYLAKSVVESSGGKIWFKSTVNKGTTFYFTLPIKGSKPKDGEVSISN